ncbi:AP-5 complex subunit sigma-1 [Rana temporaria]|uniref:AP-5 complex subunit sigma-1 n=1 Tax=Rana temporaria TaxID=8407 RepID=UPI001AAD6F59|nr:AP-5 complex subunit sigma-1 [Rana temporaria]XP_040191518.1 AP-5 complex subunit sigma-1 [Rana temporaria]
MVHGFVIHTVGAGPGEGPDLCRVLYSHLFGCNLLEEKLRADEVALEKDRARRMDQIAVVARQTESMCLLRRQVSGRPASDFIIQSVDEPVSFHEEEVGMYGLVAGDPFPQEMTVLWMGCFSLGFSLICDSLDNLTLAESTLRMLVRYLVDSLKLLTNSTNVILRADKIHLSLDRFIPQGHLLFLNHQASQALEKELNNSMTL